MAWSRRVVLRHLAGGLAAVSAGPTPRANSSTSEPRIERPVVATRSGRLRGCVLDGVCAYRGIPYGASTAAAARFLPPMQLQPWRGVRDATDCGPPCPQVNSDLPAWVDSRAASEDCLYLNVWVPRVKESKSLAVMVWIHGGAYVSGSGGLPIYDGANLARHGNVVVVTVNHRLNALGYLYLGGLSDRYRDSGNLGQLDLIAALEWVRDNIENFNGDPGNVTLFGESGGGGKITTLCQMPAAQGLFHKAIIQSGSIWATMTPETASQVCDDVFTELSIKTADIERLLLVPAAHLAAAAEAVATKRKDLLAFCPVLDGRSITKNQWETTAPTAIHQVPMLIGTNSDEAAYFVKDPINEPANDGELIARVIEAGAPVHLSADQAHTLVDRYRTISPATSRLSMLIAISTDLFLWRDAVLQAERKAKQRGSAVYMYEFAWKTPCFGRQWAPHGSEIPLMFGNLDYALAWDDKDTPAVRAAADPKGLRYRLAKSMMSAWAAFARTGDPSSPQLAWPAYEPLHRRTMVLRGDNSVVDDPRSAQRILLTQLLG
jgi:para-nitrobenzyl esterase